MVDIDKLSTAHGYVDQAIRDAEAMVRLVDYAVKAHQQTLGKLIDDAFHSIQLAAELALGSLAEAKSYCEDIEQLIVDHHSPETLPVDNSVDNGEK